MVGCGHKQQAVYAPPPPPPPAIHAPAPSVAQAPSSVPPVTNPPTPSTEETADETFVESHTPIYSETGMASWYGPPYHNHRGANGQIFDQNAMSAAHRTLPMGSLVRVTNLQTGQAAVMRITDRGPFVPDRVLDLSVASAKIVGVWRPGTAQVRIDVYEAPKPIDEGGRWCVQIGAFSKEKEAVKLEEHLERKYHTANVIEFTGPTGHWVRIRPMNDDKDRAVEIAKELKPEEGEAYLVRLD
ncbi:septal ring lytic transglycosylase RlpA family protein [Alloacidobacterium dinghuense]|uniref:Probable endolytic peptidoglycan transglycosylase RlpA n=1 Tax=Alloacidobacterium dinghuense TaxID=2763107 RepID=A0A7G8BRB8_9BACT|nr:septal ring lytic transglycosylase RlpA family protein [Alloacidobacterium dinghuense]